MAFDAEPAPSDREGRAGRRRRLARGRRGRSRFGVEALESRVLLSTGNAVSDLKTMISLSSPPSLIGEAEGADGSSLPRTLGQPPSILDPSFENGLSGLPEADASSETNPVLWHIEVLADRPDLDAWPPVVGSAAAQPASSTAPSSSASGSFSPSGPAPAPQAQAPGVLQEASDIHATRTSAQELPEDGETVLDGQWSPDDGLDLYRISMHPDTQALRVGLHVAGPQAGCPDHLVLYDGQGNVLGDLALSLPLSRTDINLLLSALGRKNQAQTIYVGVYSSQAQDAQPGSSSAADETGSTAPVDSPVPYVLDVALVPNSSTGASSPSTPAQAPPNDAPPSPMPVVPAQTGAGSGLSRETETAASSVSPPASPPPVTLARSVGVPQRASGPKISVYRSVEPLGGALSSRTTTRGIDRREGAFVDFDLLPIPEDVEGAPASEQTAEGPEPAVEPVPSDGGLPVLGAGLPVVRHIRPSGEPAPDTPPETIQAAVVLDGKAGQVQARNDAKARSTEPVAAESDRDSTTRSPRERTRSVGLLGTGVGLTYLLALTYLLPDLAAAFQASGGRKRKMVRWGLFRRWFRRK